MPKALARRAEGRMPDATTGTCENGVVHGIAAEAAPTVLVEDVGAALAAN